MDKQEYDYSVDGFRLTPPLPGSCPVCAFNHDPADPHFPKSAYYMLKFNQKHGRLPTWRDAMAHCTPEKRAIWISELQKFGVNIKEDDIKDG